MRALRRLDSHRKIFDVTLLPGAKCMLKLTQANIDNFEAIYIPHVKDCMEVGNVARLKSLIRQHEMFVEETP